MTVRDQRLGFATKTLAIGWFVLLLCGITVVILYGSSAEGPHLDYISAGLLTAGAAMIAGTLLGLLFGIPRFVSSGKARVRDELKKGEGATGNVASANKDDGPKWVPSSNLAEISDWLTKLLLGAGLVQLTSLGGPARSLIQSVAAGLDTPTQDGSVSGSAVVAAATILVLFFGLGFVMGYVLTTLWYGDALAQMAAA
jgi:hypothetical protein